MSYEYKFKQQDCWYIDSCNKAETGECRANCIRYMEMDYLMKSSNIPKARQYPTLLTPSRQDVKSFIELKNLKDNIVDFVSHGDNLYLHSDNFGNGKTTWAIKLMLKYFDEVWAGNGFRCRGIFIHVPTFLTKIKENISFNDKEFDLLRSKIIDVDIVVWDDIAATKLSDYDHTNLLTYIDQRKLNQLSNIYTGNIIPPQLGDAIGSRLSSRVWNDSLKIKFVGTDRRGVK